MAVDTDQINENIEIKLLINFSKNEGTLYAHIYKFVKIILHRVLLIMCSLSDYSMDTFNVFFLNYACFLSIQLFLISASILPQSVCNILTGQYEDVITNKLSAFISEFIKYDFDLEKIVNKDIAESDTHHSWLCVGVALLSYFAQCNWTGPHVDRDIDWLKTKREEAIKSLSLHDECNINVQKPELLYLSKKIFAIKELQSKYESCIWWLFRANLLHQHVLDENSGTLFTEIENLIPSINNLNILKNPVCKLLFNLEVARFYLCYRIIQHSEKYLEEAQSIAGLTLSLEGAMGKRTKYQQKEKAQLYLKVEINKEIFPTIDCEDVPKSLNLNDESRLEHIEFSEHKVETQLGAMEEAIILTK